MTTGKGLRVVLGGLFLAAFLFSFSAARGPALAKADYCDPYPGEAWVCYWATVNLPPAEARFLNLANPNRNWDWARVEDAYGGTVNAKCVHIRRASDNFTEQVACGLGVPVGGVNAWMKPGYLFIRHGAPGPRTIGGVGASPYFI